MSAKTVEPGDRIVAIGGRTGRDGIHGATFSSAELTGESESRLRRRGADRQRDHREDGAGCRRSRRATAGSSASITDCGAGGFSSAVGEMGAELGAEVDLDSAPLKYEGLSYTEIWISEAQERMVLAVPPGALGRAARHSATASRSRRPTWASSCDTGRLTLRYHGEVVGDLSMEFLHEGRPAVVRQATLHAAAESRAVELPARRDLHGRPAGDAGALGRLQQGMDRPPVRS